jgi:hypothetical protein
MLGLHTDDEMQTYMSGIQKTIEFNKYVMDLIKNGASMEDVKFKLEAKKAAGENITMGHSPDSQIDFVLELMDDPEYQWDEPYGEGDCNMLYLELQDQNQRSEPFIKQMSAALDLHKA